MCAAGRTMLQASVLFLAGSAAFPAQPERSLTATQLIRRSVTVNAADWNAQPRFSYRELDTKIKIDPAGRPKVEQTRTFEVSMIEGSPYERLIAIDNEPLSRAQQQQEQAKLNREILRRQNESFPDRRARLSKYQGQRSEEHTLMQQMISAFNFKLAGEEEMNRVDCYVLDAEPNLDYQPPLEKAKVLTGMKGRLWIDKALYHWVKVEAEVISPVEFGFFIAKVKPGTRFELNQAPVGDVWLPNRFTETINASVLGLYGMRSKEEEQYSDYHQTALTAQSATFRK